MIRQVLLETPARLMRSLRHALSDLAELHARASRRHPLLANAAVTPVLTSAALIAIAVQIVPPLVRPFGSHVVAEIVESDARKQGTALYDSADRFIGAFPSRLDSDRRFNRGEQPVTDTDISGRSFTIYPDHKTLFVENPPHPYLACVKRLEDSNLGNVLINPHGVDGLGLFRAARTGFRAGGSTLSSQLVQQLIRPKDQDGKDLVAKLSRKGKEIFWTVPVMYGFAPNDRRFDQYLARHLPHLQYMQEDRGTIWGIEASSQVLYGRSAQQIDPARQFILAAAVRRQLLFPLAREGKTGLRDKSSLSRTRWLRAINRARICADDINVLPDPEQRRQANATLTQLEQKLPQPQADPVIEALGRERYGERWPERARDPFRRANIFAPYAMAGLRAEFLDALGKDWSRKVAQVRMTVNITDERRFAPEFRHDVRRWLAQRSDLNPWFRPWASYTPDQTEPVNAMPEVIAAVTDGEGQLVRYYSSRNNAPYFGELRDPALRYQPQREDRQLASLGKVGSALVLLRAGADSPAARRAFAHSDTEAIERLVADADPDRHLGRETIQRLHWSEAASRDGAGRPLDTAFSFATGAVSASPRTQQWGALAITRALAGDWRPTPPPSLIGEVRLVDLAAGRLSVPLFRLADPYGAAGGGSTIAPAELINPAQREAAKLLFAAPVCTGGTLAALQHWCSQRTHFIWGKTATLDISSAFSAKNGERHTGVTLRISVAGGVEFADGRRFSFFLSVGGTDSDHPLALARPGQRGLEASALAPLIETILADLENPAAAGAAHVR